jgi:hypothetical protein
MVACVIVNWNRGPDTLRCLRALAEQANSSMTCIVVDNGSSDGSAAMIRSAHPEVTVIETGANLGYAAGNNIGIRHALSADCKYMWLLNNDTEPQPGALQAMLATAESDPRIGVVGSVVRYLDPPHAVQSWGGGQVRLWAGYSATTRLARPDEWFDYICATSMLVRSEALLDVGLFDERYFLYWEDADFSFRLRHNGWKLAVAGDAVVLHKENASTVGQSPLRDRYSTASCLRFLRRWSPHPQVASAVFLMNRLSKRVTTGQFSRLAGVMRGLRDARTLPLGGRTEA